MALPSKYVPEHWAEMKQAIYNWVRTELPLAVEVVWSRQATSTGGPPAPAKPFVRIGVLVPPTQVGFADRRVNGIAVLVATVLVATVYTITINGVPHTFDSGATPTPTSIRDGLIDAVNDTDDDVNAVAITDDTLIITWTTDEQPELAVDANLRQKIAELYVSEAVATFELDVFTDLPEEAITYATQLRASLDADTVVEALSEAGWAFRSVEGVRKGDTVIGARWEDRAGFDLRLGCRQRNVKVIDYIETVDGLVSVLTNQE